MGDSLYIIYNGMKPNESISRVLLPSIPSIQRRRRFRLKILFINRRKKVPWERRIIGEEETLGQHRSYVAAPIILLIVFAFQFLSRWLEQLKKRGLRSDTELQLRREIKQLLKGASSFSQPSTFVQAAKLKRLATAKEKELASFQELQIKEIKLSYDLYLKVLRLLKVMTYFLLICWFWGAPVTAVYQQLVQPFGKFLSFRTGGLLNNNVMVGVIPWLILSTRVSKFVCGLFK